MSTTTTEETKVSSFQDREGHYTLSLVDAKTGHKYVHRIKHADLNVKALEPMVAARLKQYEAELDAMHKGITALLRRQRGQLNNQTLAIGGDVETIRAHADAEVDSDIGAPRPIIPM